MPTLRGQTRGAMWKKMASSKLRHILARDRTFQDSGSKVGDPFISY